MTAPPQTMANPFPQNVSEDVFKDAVLRQALGFGWMRWHPLPAMNSRGRYATYAQGEKGFPDLVLARRGEVLFRELKSNTGSLTREQKHWGEELGDLWGLWRPRDWFWILEALR